MARPRMSGKDLQKSIIDLAHLYGYKVAHFTSVLATGRDGKPVYRTPFAADSKGFPDLFCLRGDRALAIEVKGDGDTLKPEQEAWGLALMTAGIDVMVATPKKWRDGTIGDFLT